MDPKEGSEETKPCWEGIALGWRRDVPDSLRPKMRGGEYLPGYRGGGVGVGGGSGVVLQSEEEPASLSSVRSDSCLNSMEYWDYTVELECIQGQSGNEMVLVLYMLYYRCQTRLQTGRPHPVFRYLQIATCY